MNPTNASPPGFDFDLVIIGTGFGGSVSALRLAEKGYKLAMLEQGRQFAERFGAADIRALLTLAQTQKLLGCNEANCLTEFGSTLAVEQMISGSVRKVGKKYAVSLLLQDLVNARTLKRASAESEATPEALLPAVRQSVAVLFGVVGQGA